MQPARIQQLSHSQILAHQFYISFQVGTKIYPHIFSGVLLRFTGKGSQLCSYVDIFQKVNVHLKSGSSVHSENKGSQNKEGEIFV